MEGGKLEVELNIKNALLNMESGPQNLLQMDNNYLYVVVLLKESTGT